MKQLLSRDPVNIPFSSLKKEWTKKNNEEFHGIKNKDSDGRAAACSFSIEDHADAKQREGPALTGSSSFQMTVKLPLCSTRCKLSA